jgi:hypothetical protein
MATSRTRSSARRQVSNPPDGLILVGLVPRTQHGLQRPRTTPSPTSRRCSRGCRSARWNLGRSTHALWLDPAIWRLPVSSRIMGIQLQRRFPPAVPPPRVAAAEPTITVQSSEVPRSSPTPRPTNPTAPSSDQDWAHDWTERTTPGCPQRNLRLRAIRTAAPPLRRPTASGKLRMSRISQGISRLPHDTTPSSGGDQES